MFDVYTIIKLDTFGNSHSTNRDETWKFVMDKSFETKKEAETYIIEKSAGLINRYKNSCGDEFDYEFCFTNDMYMAYRLYFLGKPDGDLLSKSLNDKGVTVIAL